jgi:hypothetical protein
MDCRLIPLRAFTLAGGLSYEEVRIYQGFGQHADLAACGAGAAKAMPVNELSSGA